MKKILLISLLFLGSASFSSCRNEIEYDGGPLIGNEEEKELVGDVYSRLHTEGAHIVNESGQKIILNGVNLGGWLVQEGYLLGGDASNKAQYNIKEMLYQEGKTSEEIEEFYKSWRDNFITKSDIEYIYSLGFNCIRLPMHYELFLTSGQRSVRNEVIWDRTKYESYCVQLEAWNAEGVLFNSDTEGFALIDKVVDWAKSKKMWVILDLHAAPGGQSSEATITDAFFPMDFWYKTFNQDITRKLWKVIAERYKDESTIAMFEVLNEPNAGDNTWVRDFYNRIIGDIRSTGDEHIILLNGNQMGNNYWEMTPDKFTDNINLVYSVHRYLGVGDHSENDITDTESDPYVCRKLGNLVNFRKAYNVPFWVGETGENTDDVMNGNKKALESIGVGYCHWTYKRFNEEPWAALRMIRPPYLTNGSENMAAVLENIKFNNTSVNVATVKAVKP